MSVFLALEFRFGGFVLLEAVEVFEEEEPGCLFGVIEFGGTAGFLPENVVDVLEGLFKHIYCRGGCGAEGEYSMSFP